MRWLLSMGSSSSVQQKKGRSTVGFVPFAAVLQTRGLFAARILNDNNFLICCYPFPDEYREGKGHIACLAHHVLAQPPHSLPASPTVGDAHKPSTLQAPSAPWAHPQAPCIVQARDTAHSHPKSFNHQLKLQTRCHCFENQHSCRLYVCGGVTATPASHHLLHLHLWSLSFDFSHVIPFSTLMSFTNQPAKLVSSKPSKNHLLACSCKGEGMWGRF